MVLSSKERRGVVRSQILFPRTCRLLLECNRYDQIRKKFTPLRILFPLTHCVWILLLPQQQYELNEIDLTSRCCFSSSSSSCSCSSSFSVLKRFFCLGSSDQKKIKAKQNKKSELTLAPISLISYNISNIYWHNI